MNLQDLVAAALAEDIGPGDVTTEACVDAGTQARARIVAKEPIVISGHAPAAETFRQMGAAYAPTLANGAAAQVGQTIATVQGNARALLTAERTALNFLMHLSGIATHTAAVVSAAKGMTLVDTRKTAPLYRSLQKAAVVHGGARNHRMALYDAVLIKENHIAAAGGLTEAIGKARSRAGDLFLQVEVETLEQLAVAIAAGVDGVLLDNMDDATLREAVSIAKGKALLEASGNMTAARVAALSDSGLDRISMGGLVHQARWVDLSMRHTTA